jgi:hypothetical protein
VTINIYIDGVRVDVSSVYGCLHNSH